MLTEDEGLWDPTSTEGIIQTDTTHGSRAPKGQTKGQVLEYHERS